MLNRYRQLSSIEKRALWAALPRLAIARLSLLTGVMSARRWLGGEITIQRAPVASVDLQPWKQRALALKRASRIIPDSHCLAQSLALRWWMRRHGLNAEAVIGVRRDAARGESHAWVMLDGEPIGEASDILSQYVIIFPRHMVDIEC